MAQLIATLGIAHAPGVTGWIDRAHSKKNKRVCWLDMLNLRVAWMSSSPMLSSALRMITC